MTLNCLPTRKGIKNTSHPMESRVERTTMAQKLTKTLAISFIGEEFYIKRNTDGKLDASKMEAAAPTIKERLQQSAERYCECNLQMAVQAFKACIASYKVNYKKKGGMIDKEKEELMISILSEIANSLLSKPSRTVKYVAKGIDASIPKWAYTKEQIDTIDDYYVLNAVYESMSSHMSTGTSGLSTSQFPAWYKPMRELREYVRCRANQFKPAQADTISDKLAAKLTSGKRTLTDSELKELQTLLKLQ